MPVLATFGGTSLRNFGLTSGTSSSATVLGDFESIATTTVGVSGQATIEFTSIPQTYKHLQLRMLIRTNRSSYYVDYLKTTFNSDNNANYTTHHLAGDGSSASAYGAASQNFSQILRFAGAASPSISNTFGVAIVDILDYTNTNKYKTLKNIGGTDFNGSGELGMYSGLWMSTSAISSITLTVGGGTLINQYSTVALYGMNG